MLPNPKLRVAALLNASSGAIERKGAGALRDVLASAFEKHGIAADLEFLPGSEMGSAAERARQQVIDGKLDAIVVGGGDGSVRTVASVLAGTDIPLGILPLGTLNHFARDLGIPFLAERAVAIIAAGARRAIDVGEVNEMIFVNNASIGFYPYLVLQRERTRRRKRLSKWIAMLLALPRVLRHLPLFRLTVLVEGNVEPCRSPCVFIGNNEYRIAPPGFGTRERLDGGALCLYVAETQGRLAMVWLACRCMLGLARQQRDLRIFKGASADISARRSRLLVAFDGEVATMRSPLHFKIRPGALRVFAPSVGSADDAARAILAQGNRDALAGFNDSELKQPVALLQRVIANVSDGSDCSDKGRNGAAPLASHPTVDPP
jgi:diacylglycerol kinase family enzyme